MISILLELDKEAAEKSKTPKKETPAQPVRTVGTGSLTGTSGFLYSARRPKVVAHPK